MRTDTKKIHASEAYKIWQNKAISLKMAESDLNLASNEVCRKYSPYKKDMKVVYQDHSLDFAQHGIILGVKFQPGYGVDGLWEIQILPTSSKFEPFFKDKKKMTKFLACLDDKIIKIAK